MTICWTGSDARVLISWKLPSDICCLSFIQDPIFTRETIGWLWRHRHFKLFQNIYFGQAVMQGVLKVENYRVISVVYRLFRADPIFTRETIGWLWRHRHFKLFQNIYFGQEVMQGVLEVENYRVISVVYCLFRPGSYFHARDNRLTVTSSSRQTFSKHLFWTGSDARGLIIWKLPSDICCLSFVSSRFLFSRERQ